MKSRKRMQAKEINVSCGDCMYAAEFSDIKARLVNLIAGTTCTACWIEGYLGCIMQNPKGWY